MLDVTPIWTPSVERISQTRLAAFRDLAGQQAGRSFDSHADLHRWSVEQPDAFWRLAWAFCGLEGTPGDAEMIADADPMKVRFFPEARLNIVDTFLKNADDRDAIVFCGDSPNDAPMFAHFPNACGVANVADFTGKIEAEPAWIAPSRGGAGFVEIAETLLAARSANERKSV